MNSHQRRKAHRKTMRDIQSMVEWLEACAKATGDVREMRLDWPADGKLSLTLGRTLALFCLALCTACGTVAEGEDAGIPIEDAGQTDAGTDAGEEPVDAGPLDACEERQEQWCRQGCIGTIGIDRDCPELDCEC